MTEQERRAVVARRDRAKRRAADRRRNSARRDHRRVAALAHKRRYPERVRARKLAWDAIRDGRLVRGPCERLEEGGCDGPIHGHHDDYSKPLEVRWLCREHHFDEHREEAQAA